MAARTADELRHGSCKPCEGGVAKLSAPEAKAQLGSLAGWTLGDDAASISKSWTCKDFADGMKFLDRVAEVAEAEQHHPDVHLTGYKKVRIELSTHAIGGLSENDFILAAKIDGVA